MSILFQSRTLTAEDDQNEETFRLLARQLARLHSLPMPIARNDFGTTQLLGRIDNWTSKQRVDSQLYTGALKATLQRLGCTTLLEYYLPDTIDYVRKCFSTLIDDTWPIVFTHGDLSHSNVLITEEQELRFIDFDYSYYTYRGYDLGRYFSEYDSSNPFELISEQRMRQFIEYYIEENCRIYGPTYREDSNNSVEKILEESKLFILYAHLFCASYCTWKALEADPNFEQFLVGQNKQIGLFNILIIFFIFIFITI